MPRRWIYGDPNYNEYQTILFDLPADDESNYYILVNGEPITVGGEPLTVGEGLGNGA